MAAIWNHIRRWWRRGASNEDYINTHKGFEEYQEAAVVYWNQFHEFKFVSLFSSL